MTFQFIDISIEDVSLDEAEADNESTLVYQHLKRYCEKFTPLPAITVKVKNGKLVVTRGHKYLKIARDLGRGRIRAVLLGETAEGLRRQRISFSAFLVPNSVLEQEGTADVVNAWHVFFFKSQVTDEIARQIEIAIKNFINKSLPLAVRGQTMIEFNCDLSAACIEIKFPTPVKDQLWMGSFILFYRSEMNRICPIESYQGRRIE